MVRDENSGRIHGVHMAEYKNDESCRLFDKFVYIDSCTYIYIHYPIIRGKGIPSIITWKGRNVL